MTIAVAIARIVGLDQPFDLLPHQNLRPSLPYPEPSVFAYMAGGHDWPLLPGRSWYWWPTGLGLEQDVWLQQPRPGSGPLEIHPNQPPEFDPSGATRYSTKATVGEPSGYLHPDPNGHRYEWWEEINATREVYRIRTDSNIAVSEHHLASARITG
jgi:hypothetical protein